MKNTLVSAGLVALASAQRPTNTSICDYYTGALLKVNNATNQETLLTLIVNTAVIGNYTQPNVGVMVPGILNPNATYKGNPVNLLQYFDGMLDSTNNGGKMGVSMNFLDGGGAAPLMKNLPADNSTSAQYTLLTHLYGFFANLLGCTEFGSKVMPYAGSTNMYEVHKFMALSEDEFAYFVSQVGLSALSFGAAQSDVDAVGMALTQSFGMRCAAPAAIPATASPEPQAICIESDCPMATSADCSIYASVMEPATATPASVSASATATTAASAPATSATAPVTSAVSSAAPSAAPTSVAPPAPTMTPYSGAGAFDIPIISSLGLAVFGVVALWL